eukprot:1021261-Pelagomonas_calceolata.AAC.1
MKTKKGHSAGEYKNSLKHGVSNQFQASWLEENGRVQVVWDCVQLPFGDHQGPRADCQAPKEGGGASASSSSEVVNAAEARCNATEGRAGACEQDAGPRPAHSVLISREGPLAWTSHH